MKKNITAIGLILFFLSGTIYVMRYFNHYQQICLLGSIALIYFFNISTFAVIALPKDKLSNIYILFVVTICISGVITMKKSSFIAATGMYLIWLLCVPWMTKHKSIYVFCKNKIHIYYLLPFAIVMIYSIALYPIRLYRYSGAFVTSNGTGDTAATACAACLSLLGYDLKKNRPTHRITVDIIITVFTVFISLISTCRGAIITVIIMLIVFFCVLIHESIISPKSAMKIIGILLFVFLIGLLLYQTDFFRTAIDNVIYKFNQKSEDTFDGRTERWDVILGRAKWFGNGSRGGIAAHNSYLSILDQYGVIAALLLVLFVITGLISSFKFAWSKNDTGNTKFFPLFVYIAFACMSLTEGMMLKTVMLACVWSIPLLNIEKEEIV
ncbi:O-antigen ligase family protein [Ruminococcus albus]|uniref:O-antigen ligase like membrane protein n=1 Tax=Ruminococcus albus TaxID=1264 RepID=A0A1H7KQB8_RUMAL|nr:O-antigen ligase family protein [Ruminococcus albus]SEK88962.1 hypothetical protein SAMN05216469_10757 [Ruminococcus albus]